MTEQLTLSLFFIEKKIKIYNIISRQPPPRNLELVLFIILVIVLLISFYVYILKQNCNLFPFYLRGKFPFNFQYSSQMAFFHKDTPFPD